jgi:hypothetical protein
MILAMEVLDMLAGAAKGSRERAVIANYILGHSLHRRAGLIMPQIYSLTIINKPVTIYVNNKLFTALLTEYF